MQFIISTHSPLVLSGVENKPKNVVYCMHVHNDSRPLTVHHTYGIDANSLIAENMDAVNRTEPVLADCVYSKILMEER